MKKNMQVYMLNYVNFLIINKYYKKLIKKLNNLEINLS